MPAVLITCRFLIFILRYLFDLKRTAASSLRSTTRGFVHSFHAARLEVLINGLFLSLAGELATGAAALSGLALRRPRYLCEVTLFF